MGKNSPKSERDRLYREMAARFLEGIMDRRDLKKGRLADALGVDRSVASRYLSRDVRPPLHRLQYLERTIGEVLPHEIVEAFWQSEERADSERDAADLAEMVRSIGAELAKESDPKAREAARRELETLLKKLA